jgi:hypothetical protein
MKLFQELKMHIYSPEDEHRELAALSGSNFC